MLRGYYLRELQQVEIVPDRLAPKLPGDASHTGRGESPIILFPSPPEERLSSLVEDLLRAS